MHCAVLESRLAFDGRYHSHPHPHPHQDSSRGAHVVIQGTHNWRSENAPIPSVEIRLGKKAKETWRHRTSSDS